MCASLEPRHYTILTYSYASTFSRLVAAATPRLVAEHHVAMGRRGTERAAFTIRNLILGARAAAAGVSTRT